MLIQKTGFFIIIILLLIKANFIQHENSLEKKYHLK